MNSVCKIIKDFPRLSPALIERFRNIPASNVDDCLGRTAAIDPRIAPMGKGKLLGSAFTVRLPAGDNLMLHAAMDLAKPGDVIMIDAEGALKPAIFGELMASYMRSRGIAGAVCDGAIRDRDALAEMDDFPVYARAAVPDGPLKEGPGEIGVPVMIGGKTVCPGDLIIGDCDGVIVVPAALAEETLPAAEAVVLKEADILEHILKDGSFPRPWVAEKLAALGCETAEQR